jgi:hypothetical protein
VLEDTTINVTSNNITNDLNNGLNSESDSDDSSDTIIIDVTILIDENGDEIDTKSLTQEELAYHMKMGIKCNEWDVQCFKQLKKKPLSNDSTVIPRNRDDIGKIDRVCQDSLMFWARLNSRFKSQDELMTMLLKLFPKGLYGAVQILHIAYCENGKYPFKLYGKNKVIFQDYDGTTSTSFHIFSERIKYALQHTFTAFCNNLINAHLNDVDNNPDSYESIPYRMDHPAFVNGRVFYDNLLPSVKNNKGILVTCNKASLLFVSKILNEFKDTYMYK